MFWDFRRGNYLWTEMKEIQWIKTRENVRCEEKGMLREARTKNIGKRRSDQKNNAGRNGYPDETRVGKCEETV